MDRTRRYFVETFGCQMNVNDSEKVAGLLRAEGYEPTETPADADFVFVNTCAVREKAAEKLFSSLGRLKQLKATRPDLKIGVGGCVAQLEGTAILERAPYVDVLVGTHNIARVPELVAQPSTGETRVDLDRRADSFTVPDAVVAHSSRVRAYVTAIEGCNHVCSFCVVPRTRGPEVCRAPEAIVAEVESVVARGYSEVMLLGQTVNAYRHGAVDFPDLLARTHDVAGLARLRFTTSHPSEVTRGMAEAFRDLPRLCPYLHLPVQSGSDTILHAMRRGYSRGEYLEKIAMLRECRPDIALSGDVIVGYPGETEREFEETVSLVEAVGFDGLFVFTYSPRPGTTALRDADDVSEAEKRRRFHVLNNRQQRAQALQNERLVGTTQRVLLEEEKGTNRLMGRTPQFRIVHCDGPVEWIGRFVDVEVTRAAPNSLVGVVAAPEPNAVRAQHVV
jgi:tRNA-2-methylthio-N6-dimethylallyladenosine synthase